MQKRWTKTYHHGCETLRSGITELSHTVMDRECFKKCSLMSSSGLAEEEKECNFNITMKYNTVCVQIKLFLLI